MSATTIEAYKPYVNHPAYDLVAINPRNKKLARISVKSRWATNRAGFLPLASLDCDFVVHVALNRGHRQGKMTINDRVEDARLYVFPIAACARARSSSNKINIRNIERVEEYEGNWTLISRFLET